MGFIKVILIIVLCIIAFAHFFPEQFATIKLNAKVQIDKVLTNSMSIYSKTNGQETFSRTEANSNGNST